MKWYALTRYGLAVGALATSFGLGHAAARVSDAGPDDAQEMERALRMAFEEPDPEARALDMRQLLARVDETTLPGAEKAFRELSATSDAMGVSEFFALWSRIDLHGMMTALASWPDDRAAAQGMGWAAYRLALAEGTDAATLYYDSLPDSVRLLTGYRLVEGALNAGDEARLVHWLATLPDEGERSRLTQGAVFKLLRERGVEGTAAFFESIPPSAPGRFKQQAYGVLLERLARVDARAAIAFHAAHASEDWADGGALRLALAWADVDPRAALAWIESRSAVTDHDRLVEAVVDRWAMHDEEAAIDWARAQPQSPMLDRIRARFAGSTIIRAPERSIELSGRIVDTELKREALHRFARYWFTRRPEETGGWLAKAGLSDAEAEGMIRSLTDARARRLGRSPRDRG